MADYGPGPEVMSAGTLTGDDVVNAQGEDLGKIEDIMLDTNTGRVAYAVLSFGGFLGMGDKLFAIPWNALQLDPANHRFVLNVEKERLENAPGFDKDHWPKMGDTTWASEIHSYYGTQPYWESGTTTGTGTSGLGSSGTSTGYTGSSSTGGRNTI